LHFGADLRVNPKNPIPTPESPEKARENSGKSGSTDPNPTVFPDVWEVHRFSPDSPLYLLFFDRFPKLPGFTGF
jgi:hypothetical protein